MEFPCVYECSRKVELTSYDVGIGVLPVCGPCARREAAFEEVNGLTREEVEREQQAWEYETNVMGYYEEE